MPQVRRRSGRGRLLVVDVGIARSAADAAIAVAEGKACGEFLERFRSAQHRLVMTQEICTEWTAHMSGWTNTWLLWMQRKGRYDWLENVVDNQLRAEIRKHALDSDQERRALKDIRHVEGALASERRVASSDAAARADFRQLSRSMSSIGRIVWVNPCEPSDSALNWLSAGCPDDAWRTLGYTT